MLNVTLLSGEGAAGKSTLLMQLAGSTVLGKGWIGMIPAQGSALYVSCEEDHDEVRRRMEDVAAQLGSTRPELIERGLRALSFAGLNAILGEPDRAGVIRPTRLFIRIRSEAQKLRPKLVVIDTVADTFGGDEIKRAQARQFITILRGLAISAGAAVVLAAHPSLAGIANDSGLSGSTGWHNSVRARAYFKAGPGEDAGLRALEFRKNNYGPPDAPTILLRWANGVYVVETEGSFEEIAAQAEMDQLFLKLLRRFAEQGRHVSDKPSSSYAPAAFVDDPDAKAARATKKKLAEAMARLFAAKRIRVVAFGRPGKSRSYISENNPAQPLPDAQIIPFPAAQRPPNDAVGPPNPPPNGYPTPPPDVPNTPPIPPTPLGGANGALLEAGPAPRDGVSPAKKPPLAYEVIGQAPAGERCSLCGSGSPRPMRIKHGGETDIWHPECADKYIGRLE
jgi:archaellum biogenesis ATPase FlaH